MENLERKNVISIRIDDATYKALYDLAKSLDLSKSYVASIVLIVGLKYAEIAEKKEGRSHGE